jgi:hypothetical protein
MQTHQATDMAVLSWLGLLYSLIKGGVSIMVDLYVALIIAKRRTIDRVPVQLREAVLAELTALGLDGYGNPIVP